MINLRATVYIICFISIFGCKKQVNNELLYDIEERLLVNTSKLKGAIDSIRYTYIREPKSPNNEVFIYKETFMNPEFSTSDNCYITKYYLRRGGNKVFIAPTSPFDNDSLIFFDIYYRLDSKEKFHYSITDRNAPLAPPVLDHTGSWTLVGSRDSIYTLWGEACSRYIRFAAFYDVDNYLRVDSIYYNKFLRLKLDKTQKYKSSKFNRHLHFDKLSYK